LRVPSLPGVEKIDPPIEFARRLRQNHGSHAPSPDVFLNTAWNDSASAP
jgi:hypothetical protein